MMERLQHRYCETAKQVEICPGSPYAILCDHAQSSCKLCSPTLSVEQKHSILQLYRPTGQYQL
ncbi:UNVERIFIED_CONTAM: hypothetical protein NCL1_49825 [Trichonephila clavipes]